MDPSLITQLSDINLQFYQSCAHSFSQTRQRVQPGVRRIITSYLSPFDNTRLLDLGCGNGDLLPALDEALFSGNYTGLDFSSGLIQENGYKPSHFSSHFLVADLTREGWSETLDEKPFDHIFSFAVLHHIPSEQIRLQLLREIRTILQPEGKFVFSVWQFLRSPRLAKRIQPWETAQINAKDLEEGDFLLDWRASDEISSVLRYVHVYSESELARLANEAGFLREERFSSDGKEGNLSDYEIWKVAPA